MAFLPSLVHELCPAFDSAVQLRVCCKALALALPPAAISVLALTEHIARKSILNKVASNYDTLHARLWAKLLAKSLVQTLESFSVFLCPHVRFFADEEIILAQFQITLVILGRSESRHLLHNRTHISRIAVCNHRVDALLRDV